MSAPTGAGAVLRRPFSRRRAGDNIAGWLFIAPNILWVGVFTAYPLLSSFVLSFREWNPVGVNKYVGLANYQELLSDWVFLLAYKNALVYALITVPAGLVWGIALALALQNARGRLVFRALYFLPTITSGVAIAIMWAWVLNADFGLLNGVLRLIGVSGPNWLGDSRWALPSVSGVVVWHGTGYWMIIFLAALLDVPQEYVDAARVDGANRLQTFRHVTLPMLTPSIFYYLTNALITVWIAFELPFVMTGGGPANATLMPAQHLYQVGWQEFRMGYASALAWVMASLIFVFTALHFALARRWVHYGR
jgi:multiple sugar transport system permease protein